MKILAILIIIIGAISCTSIELVVITPVEKVIVEDNSLTIAIDSTDMYRYGK